MRALPRYCLRSVSAVALTLMATSIMAQPGPGWHHRHFRGDGAPVARLVERLDLTAEQRDEIRQIVRARHEAMRDQQEQLRERREALADAVHAQVFDEAAIRAAAAGVAELEADFAVERALGLQQILDVLTPEQRDAAQTMIQEHRERKAAGESGLRGPRSFRGRGGAWHDLDD